MPRPKAHWMGDVRLVDQGGDYATVYVTVRDVDDDRQPIGSEYELELMQLNDGDAYKACAAVGINPKESRFMGTDGRVKRLADVRRVLVVEGVATWAPRNAGAPAFKPEPEPKQEEDRYRDEPAPKPVESPKPVDSSSPFGALESWIRDVAGKAMDEGQVRAIVSDAVKDLAPNVTQITLPNWTEYEIEGKQHSAFDKVLRYASIRQHVWMTGPAGTGKTQLAENVAKALQLPFYSVQCNPQLLATELKGYMNATGSYVRVLFREAFENGGVFLFDEIDNSHPSTLAMMNAALANGQCAFPDGMVTKHPDFVCLAAANTWGTGADDQYVGRMRIDAATLNRFRRVSVGIDEELEEHVVRSIMVDRVQADTWLGKVRKARANVKAHNLRVIVSPRDAIEGAKSIVAGFSMEDAANDSWLAGLGPDDMAKVNR